MTIITAADQTYFRTLMQFLRSCIRFGLQEKHRIIVYDLGLTERRQTVLNRFLRVHSHIEYRPYPRDMKVHVQTGIRRCVWKPILIDAVLQETKSTVLWLDAGTRITGAIDELEAQLERDGCFVPYSGRSDIDFWTHEDTLRFLKTPPDIRTKRNRCGGVCGFDYRNEAVRELIRLWKQYALTEACIAPKGADRSNHRFDQSILSILLYQFEKTHGLHLTDGEVDISSPHPLSYLSVRNQVPDFVPLGLDGLCRFYFHIRRHIDIWHLKSKKQTISGP